MPQDTTPPADPAVKWREIEYQALTKHFEEIYKLGATTATVVVTGCGAVFAYAGISFFSFALAGILVGLWFAAFLYPVFSYTVNVLTRLAKIEDDAGQTGHFSTWRKELDTRRGVWLAGSRPLKLMAVSAAVVTVLSLLAWLKGLSPTAKTIDVTLSEKTPHGEIVLKSSVKPDQLATETTTLSRQLEDFRTRVAPPQPPAAPAGQPPASSTP